MINNDDIFLDIAAGKGNMYVVYEEHMFDVFMDDMIKKISNYGKKVTLQNEKNVNCIEKSRKSKP